MRCLPIAVVLAALTAAASAQEVVIRSAEPATSTMTAEDFVLRLPTGSIRKSLSGTWVNRSSGQPFEFVYDPYPESGIQVTYKAEGRVEDGFGNGMTPGWSQYVGFKQRPAVVAKVGENLSFETAVEDQTRFDRASNIETLRKAELVGRTTAPLPGLNASATVGKSENNDFLGVIRDQAYGRLWAEQQVPLLPVKVSVAPYLAREETPDLEGSRRLVTGWDSSVTLQVFEPTALSLGTSQSQGNSLTTDATTGWSSYYSQIEQKVAENSSVKLRAGYEHYEQNSLPMNEAVVVGAESSFLITDSISGGFQLRHRAMQFLQEAGAALPETIFSLSIGGSF